MIVATSSFGWNQLFSIAVQKQCSHKNKQFQAHKLKFPLTDGGGKSSRNVIGGTPPFSPIFLSVLGNKLKDYIIISNTIFYELL